MDRLHELFEALRLAGVAQGQFRGLLHILVGRRITLPDGTLVSAGMTWRELAGYLKKWRWDPESVRDLGLDPAALPPRDRYKYWYTAISQAQVHTPQACAEGDSLAAKLAGLGYLVGPAPGTSRPGPSQPA